MKTEYIRVDQFTLDEFAVSRIAALKVFEKVKEKLSENCKVVLSFSGISVIVSMFFSITVGYLYREFTKEYLNAHLSVIGLDKRHMVLLEKIKNQAIAYYKENPK